MSITGSRAIWYSVAPRRAVLAPRHGHATIPEGALQSIFNGARLPKPRK